MSQLAPEGTAAASAEGMAKDLRAWQTQYFAWCRPRGKILVAPACKAFSLAATLQLYPVRIVRLCLQTGTVLVAPEGTDLGPEGGTTAILHTEGMGDVEWGAIPPDTACRLVTATAPHPLRALLACHRLLRMVSPLAPHHALTPEVWRAMVDHVKD